jgi:methionyl aminopeptidase
MLIKTPAEQKQIQKGGELMGKILQELRGFTRAGMSLAQVDAEAERLIIAAGGRPAFKGYRSRPQDIPFPSTICASVNEELVHGIARPEVFLKDGDIFSIDIGMEWPVQNLKSKGKSSGYFTDTAITFAIGKVSSETKKLLYVTRQSLEEGIKAAQPGSTIAAIGRAIENYVRSQGGYGIVEDLVGHGVGHQVHEDPVVPNYYDPALEKIKLRPGMVLALEPMLSLSGETHVRVKRDGWTMVMADQSLCAHSEHTLIITKTGNIVVTRRPGEEQEEV